MAIDDDIAASLPEPPPAAPARRDAAIGAALARFDGTEPAAAPAVPRPVRGWRPGRSQVGALVSAALVLFVGIPALWMSSDAPPIPAPRAVSPASKIGPPGADADVAARPGANLAAQPRPATVAPARAAAPAPVAPASSDVASSPSEEASTADIEIRANRRLDQQALVPSAVSTPGLLGRAQDLDAEGIVVTAGRNQPLDKQSEQRDDIIVTGAKVSRPGAAARAKRAARRGDWNACTVRDPARSLEGCRRLIDPSARGVRGQAGAHVADGLARAWRGDRGGAVADFDRAIAIDPKSGIAYLNRGLARQEDGDEAGALEDLDRAVRYGGTARAYYNRSLVRRARGDIRRAAEDEDRAVALDPRYADLLE